MIDYVISPPFLANSSTDYITIVLQLYLTDSVCCSRKNIDVHYVNRPLPDCKVLASSKLKAFADDNVIMAEMVQSFFDKVENIVGKGENAGYQHFLLFLQCFQKSSFSGSLKVAILW